MKRTQTILLNSRGELLASDNFIIPLNKNFGANPNVADLLFLESIFPSLDHILSQQKEVCFPLIQTFFGKNFIGYLDFTFSKVLCDQIPVFLCKITENEEGTVRQQQKNQQDRNEKNIEEELRRK